MATKDCPVVVGNYRVNLNEEIGIGHRGRVYKATDSKDNDVAVKKIDIKKMKETDIQEAIGFFKAFGHKNLVPFYDYEIQQQTDVLWVFIEFCSHGDLDRYFLENFALLSSTEAKISLMQQMAEGLQYVHDQDFVHGDITPGKFLITNSNIPANATVKLNFLSVNPFLESQGARSSKRRSEIDTTAWHFMSPEDFDMYEPTGDLHSRDTFALGLTFLSMIQSRDGAPLQPVIESDTVDDYDSEDEDGLSIGIGYFMFTRQENVQSAMDLVGYHNGDSPLLNGVKKLIAKMTYITPQDRIHMDKLVNILLNKDLIATVTLEKSSNDTLAASALPLGIEESPIADTLKVHVSLASAFKTNTLPWYGTKFCHLQDKGVVIRGRTTKKSKLKRLFHAKGDAPTFHHYSQQGQGEMLKSWPAPCCKDSWDERTLSIIELHIDAKQYLAMSCRWCETITLYSFPNGNVESIFNIENAGPGKMCYGPENTLLVSDCGGVIQFSYSASNLERIQRIPVGREHLTTLCYSNQQIFYSTKDRISSTDIVSKQTLWTVGVGAKGRVEIMEPRAMCTDKNERLYIADFDYSWRGSIIVLHVKTGLFIQNIDLLGIGDDLLWRERGILDLAWYDTQPHLALCTVATVANYYAIAYYNIEK